MSPERQRIPRPPKLRTVHEVAPQIDPPLRDMPEWPGEPVDEEPRPFDVELTDPYGELLAAAEERARGDDHLRELLDGHRHALIGAAVREDKDGRPGAVFVAYDYEANVAIEVTLAGDPRDLEVVEVERRRYQPAPSDEEIERATEIARGDRRVAAHLTDDLEPTAILVSDVEQGDRHHGRRRIEIGFQRPDERRARVRVIVDVGEDRVIGVRSDHHHRDDEEGPR